MNAVPWTKADLRQMAAKGDRMAATVLMLWEMAETDPLGSAASNALLNDRISREERLWDQYRQGKE